MSSKKTKASSEAGEPRHMRTTQRGLKTWPCRPRPLLSFLHVLTGWKDELGAALEPVSCRYSSHRKFSGFG